MTEWMKIPRDTLQHLVPCQSGDPGKQRPNPILDAGPYKVARQKASIEKEAVLKGFRCVLL